MTTKIKTNQQHHCLKYKLITAIIAILVDMRWLRLTYYLLMFFFGITLGLGHTKQALQALIHNPQLISQILWCCWSIIFAGLASIIFNNIADQDIDIISNPKRPLIQGKITCTNYWYLAWSATAASIICATCAGRATLCAIVAIILTYYLYSMPPIRYKKITVISKVVISGNSLILIYLGYFLITHTSNIPPILIPLMLISGTIAANYIDLKDIPGDQANNIKTLPIVLGTPMASKLIGGAFVVTYLGLSCLFNNYLYVIIFAGSGAIMFYLITKKNYQDNLVTSWQLINLIGLMLLWSFQ